MDTKVFLDAEGRQSLIEVEVPRLTFATAVCGAGAFGGGRVDDEGALSSVQKSNL